jgi:hypothetical protein
MTYRESILDRLYRSALRAQSEGRWETADTYLSLASRYEALWAALDGGWKVSDLG